MPQSVYVSITGLQVRHLWYVPIFWHHAVRSMAQAQASTGCLGAEARTINGIHHTRSLWKDKDAMLDYIASGAHRKAVRAFQKIATGKTFGYETTQTPDWPEVHRLWCNQGRWV